MKKVRFQQFQAKPLCKKSSALILAGNMLTKTTFLVIFGPVKNNTAR
ncbi:hypothetical protein [Geotalea uraniireducens]|nr:hypothetical protein [Geotalea uraniireducens]